MTPQESILKLVCSIPSGHGRIVGIVPYRDEVLVAMENGDIFTLSKSWLTDKYHTIQTHQGDTRHE